MYQAFPSDLARSTPLPTESLMRQAIAAGAMFGSACQGGLSLTRALAGLRQCTDADLVTLVRVVRNDATYLIATTGLQAHVIEDRDAAFVQELMTRDDRADQGHIVTSRLDRTHQAVVLQATAAFTDLLIVSRGAPVLLADFAAVAVPMWTGRRAGLAIAAIGQLRNLSQPAQAVAEDVVTGCILSAENPARLTPTEFRVAIGLRDGLSPAAIGTALQMAMPTVRTHLRNIYAKTGLRGMHELTHRLHADNTVAA